MNEYVVEMKGIVKNFGQVQAVKHGEFTLKKGEIHSLIGENGAGKSTMMKLLYGMYPIDEGEIIVKGEPMGTITPKLAIEHGVGMVHQEFMLVNELTVLENIILGFEPKKGLTIDFDKARKEVKKYIEQYHMDVQLDKKVSQISVGEAQRVEIIKTLMRGADIIILDEPTAVLTPQEAERLFEILNNLKQDGKSLVFISHKLNEVMAISDRISVMRQGQYMGTVNKEETSPLDLTKRMIGREVFLNIDKAYSEAGDTILEVQDVWIPSQKETSKIRGMSLHVKAGEIVGVAGIDGNGQSELVEAITGLRKVEKGKILLCGKDITNQSPRKVRESGLSHIPEDRNTRGLNRAMTIEENLALAYLRAGTAPHAIFSRISRKDKELFREKLSLLDMGLEDRMKQPVGLLSGGQRQALTLLMATLVTPKLLLLDEHTAALDPATAEKVLELTRNIVAEKKITCLMVTHNMHQALELGNRTLMMDAGRVVFDVQGEERSRMTVDDLLEKFRENAGKTLDNDRILLSKVEQ